MTKLEELHQAQIFICHVKNGRRDCANFAPAATASKQKGQPKKSTMFLVSAELFPLHASTHSEQSFRGVVQSASPEFHEALNWIVTAKQAEDVAIISDGRGDAARNQIRD